MAGPLKCTGTGGQLSTPPRFLALLDAKRSFKRPGIKGGLISETFLYWLHPPKNVPNHYPEHLFFGGNAQDSVLAHFSKTTKTFLGYSHLYK